MSDPRIDFAAGVLVVTMRVVNPTSRAVLGPIDIVVDRLMNQRDRALGLTDFKVANADRGGTGDGARWTFQTGPGAVLQPHGKTPSKVLRFSFTGGIPAQPNGTFAARRA